MFNVGPYKMISLVSNIHEVPRQVMDCLLQFMMNELFLHGSSISCHVCPCRFFCVLFCLFLYRLWKHFFILILIGVVVRIDLGKTSSYASQLNVNK
jgi:hypothetical protein